MSRSAEKPVALVLGGTRPHIALIENLKARGFYTVLVDYYDNPPARAVADEHVRESTLDQDVVLTIAERMDARLVISACVDQANVTAAYVAEKLGLPAPYSYPTALALSRKSAMKAIMRDHHIPTPGFRVVAQEDMLASLDLDFPLVVKPVDSNSSKGVKKAADQSELLAYYRQAREISRSKDVIVEKFLEGFVVSAYFYVQDGLAEPIMLMRKFFWPSGRDTVISSYASYIPANISDNAAKEISRIADAMVRAFNLKQTPFFMEVMVRGDEVNVIEAAPRIGGGLSYRVIDLGLGLDIIDAAVDAHLGTPVQFEAKAVEEIFLIQNVYCFPGRFLGFQGIAQLLQDGLIDEFYQYKATGTTIGATLSSGERAGSFIVRAASLMDAINRCERAMAQLAAPDDSGRDLVRHDIYLRWEHV